MKSGSMLLDAFLPQLLNMVESEVELVNSKDQEQENQDDECADFTHIIDEEGVEPHPHRTAEDGTFRSRHGDEGE